MLQDKLSSGADFAQLAMDYSEDMNSSAMGGDLGYVPESALNQADPALKRIVLGMKPGQVSPTDADARKRWHEDRDFEAHFAGVSGGNAIFSDPQVQQTIRDTLRNHKEQLLRAAYLTIARDDARVTNYLAQQVIEAAGKLPDAAKTDFPSKATGH